MTLTEGTPTTARSDAPPHGATALLGRVEAPPAPRETIDAPQREPWERSEAEWDRLEPPGLYARRVRTMMLYAIGALLALPAALLIAPLTLINGWLHGGLARAFFTQQRVGRRGRVYVIYKFRTMRDDPHLPDEARVTRMGRFLRNSHLDELPQFLNLLRGEMCLIGPRPEMVEVERWAAGLVPRFSERLVLRPGITGLAQITQGYAAQGDAQAYERKVAINEAYAERLGLATDLGIVVRTALWMLQRKGWMAAPPAAADPLTD